MKKPKHVCYYLLIIFYVIKVMLNHKSIYILLTLHFNTGFPLTSHYSSLSLSSSPPPPLYLSLLVPHIIPQRSWCYFSFWEPVFPPTQISKCKCKDKIRPATGHEGPEVEQRYTSTLSLTPAPDGVGGQIHALAALPPGWMGPSAGLDGCGKSRPHRDSIPGPSNP